MALEEIHDNKLFRSTHRSFAAYAEERFGFKRTYTHYLIKSASAAENVHHGEQITSERQSREVAKAPPKKQSEVVERGVQMAAEQGKAPTAKIYEQARKEVMGEAESVQHAGQVETEPRSHESAQPPPEKHSEAPEAEDQYEDCDPPDPAPAEPCPQDHMVVEAEPDLVAVTLAQIMRDLPHEHWKTLGEMLLDAAAAPD